MSNGDPIGSDEPRGKSNAKRMGRYDGSWTPTEQRTRDELMKQFCRDEGPPPSSAYLNAPCWCACGRLKAEGRDECAKCFEVNPLTIEHRRGEHAPRSLMDNRSKWKCALCFDDATGAASAH